MKHLGLLLLAIAFVACRNNEPGESEKPSYITIDENKIETDFLGLRTRIAVSSNCDWRADDTPEWLAVEKVVVGGEEYLDIDVKPNDTEKQRETTVTLSHGRTMASLYVVQSGNNPEITLQWHSFAVNSLADATYELLDDGVSRQYRISGKKVFVTRSLLEAIYPGHLINHRINHREMTTYDQYTYNPITIGTYVSGKYYESEGLPSYAALNEMAQQIIADLPKQNSVFSFPGAIQYTSHRHLHLLGFGNLGLALDEFISGQPYSVKEMEKRTGLIYNYSMELFNIQMDYPEKLIQETVDRELSDGMLYVNSMTYGRTALLLVESDCECNAVKNVVNKIRQNGNLTEEEERVKSDLDVWYIYVDYLGYTHTIPGDYLLINRFIDEINLLPIIPLSFTTNKFSDNSVGEMSIEWCLP